MVVTRRGVRVSSPDKTVPDQSSVVQVTPTTGQRARRTAKEADTSPQHTLLETNSQLHKSAASFQTSSMKRCTRVSRLHSSEQPSTPVGSTHEADMSDPESCCSVVSGIEPLVTCIRDRKKQFFTVGQEEEMSEVESCSSALKTRSSSRRSTRKKTLPEILDPGHVEQEHVKVDQVLETEACSSMVTKFRRSQRKSARTISTANQQPEVSDADSCMLSDSATGSTTRRATRSVKQTLPDIPFHLDEASESSRSPAQTALRTRAARRKPAASADASEPQSCESEGFESGPTYSMATRSRCKTRPTAPKATDSESELTDVYSPVGSLCSVQSTPCSSRTGSGNSRRGTPASRRLVKDLSMAVENVGEQTEEHSSLNDSRLEITVIAEEADCTLLEEDKGVTVIPEGDSHFSSSVSDMDGCAEAAVSEPALAPKDQQEELFAENKDGDTSEMEIMQEMFASPELLKPCQSLTVIVADEASDITDERDKAVDVPDVDTRPTPRTKAMDEDAVAEHQCSVVEKIKVSTLKADDQQEVETSDDKVESILVTSKQQHKITDICVQNTKVISLLESSDDEDDYDEVEEMDGSEEEELDHREEDRGRPSKKWELSAASVDGLFMIDTTPGEDADEQYYKERPTEQEEKAQNKDEQEAPDEEFVDEEGDDDDDDDAEILFSSRDPHSRELSSRIDPGVRVKALGGLYINFDGGKSKPVSSSLLKLKEKKIQDELMKKSVIGPDFEKKDAVPPYSESKQALKLKRREERAKSTGNGWFNMKAPELTQELKRDLQVLKMRGSMDPKRFYKKNDRDGFPKYFQVGTVMDSAVDYHFRIPKKQRKRTMVEELLADAEFRHKNKKKFQHILMEKAAQGAGKRNKKKFHKK